MLVAIIILLIHFVPFYILISVSFKEQMDLTSRWSLPNYLNFENFILALEKGGLLKALMNTAVITVISVTLIVIFGSMAAYPLSRVKSKINRILLSVILAVMMIPPLSVLVPLYKTMVTIGGVNTYWGIILISVTYNLPISIFLFSILFFIVVMILFWRVIAQIGDMTNMCQHMNYNFRRFLLYLHNLHIGSLSLCRSFPIFGL